MLNSDYKDMLRCLSDEGVKFLLVGAYAMAAHGHVRATVDMDLWVMPSPTNAQAVLRALRRFGAPMHNLTARDFEMDDTVFQIGVAPRRIDVMTTVSGLAFDEVFARSIATDIDGIEVRIPSIDDLIRNKRVLARAKDLADAEAMDGLRNDPSSPA